MKEFRFLFFLTVLIGLPIVSFAQWTNLTNSHYHRFESQTVIHDNKIYSITGFGPGLDIESGVEVYDPALDIWTELSPMPLSKYENSASEAGVTHMGVRLVGDSIWVVGGRTGDHPGTLTEEVWIYDIAADKWTAGPDLPLPLAGGGMVAMGRKLFVFGGFTSACNGDQDSYHLTLDIDAWAANPANSWIDNRTPMPNPRNHVGATAFGGHIYVFGGQLGHDCCASGVPCGTDVTFADRYDPESDTWTSLPNLPYPRSHVEATTFAMDGKVYVSSSETGATIAHTTLEYDPVDRTWSENTALELPTGILAPIIQPMGDELYLLNGGYGGTQNPTDSAKVLTLTRSPQYKLGFSTDTASFLVYQNGTASGANFLWTVDGEANYSLTIPGAPDWLSLTQKNTGTVGPTGTPTGFEIYATGLTEGTYFATIMATGTGEDVLNPSATVAYSADSFVVRLVVGPSPDGVLEMASVDQCEGVIVGNSSLRTVSLSTPGAVSLTITSISLSNTTGFQLQTPLSSTVAPGESETVQVNFTPPVAGVHSTYLIVTHDGSSSPDTTEIACSAENPCLVPVNWVSMDLGTPTLSGSMCESGGTYQLSAAGKDIWSSSDEGHFLATRVVGNGEIVVKINSLDNVDDWSKVGLMMRASLEADARHAFVCVTPNNGVAFQFRSTDGGSCNNTKSSGLVAPQWLRISRAGDLITGYFSSDGVSWAEVSGGNNPQTVSLGDTIWVGLAMTSHDPTQIANAEAEQLSMSFSAGPFPVELLSFEGWRSNDDVMLQWESGLESAFSHYEVTRLDTNNQFQPIGSVEAAGAGWYQWTDKYPLNRMNVYRLNMVDLDGSVAYSPVIEVTGVDPQAFSVTTEVGQLKLYWQIYADEVEVRVIDMTGRILLSESITPSPGKVQVLPTTSLPAGWYHVHIAGPEGLHGESVLLR